MNPPAALIGRTHMPAWIVWSLRGTATLHLITVLGQAIIAGRFVTGEVDLLALHSLNALVVAALVFFQLVAAILLWRPGGGATWPLWVSALQLVLVVVQISLGTLRLVAPHIPLAMVILGLAATMTVWTWRGPLRAAA
jgi:hypothetical protein